MAMIVVKKGRENRKVAEEELDIFSD